MRSLRPLLACLLLGAVVISTACDDDEDRGSGADRGGSAGTGGKAGSGAGEESASGAPSGGKPSATGGFGGGGGIPGEASAGEPGTTSGGALASAGSGGESGTGAGGEAGRSSAAPRHLYVGCSDAGAGTLLTFAVVEGALMPLPTTLAGGNISNAAFNAAESLMYVAHQVVTGPETRVTTYARDASTGALTAVGSADVPMTAPGGGGTGGGGAGGGGAGGGGAGGAPANPGPQPQTLTLDAGENFLAVPNYNADNVYVYDVLPNGTVGAIVSSDAGGDKAHHALFSKNGRFLLVPYLGANMIRVYGYDAATGAITLDSDQMMPAVGSGPRHLALHENGSWLYAIHETSTGAAGGTIDLFSLDETNGDLTPVSTVAVPLPAGYSGSAKNGSEIELSPSGKFLYVSMRLDSTAVGSIVVYSIGNGGALTLVEQVSSRGVTPRHFSLSKDGTLLAVANQTSGSLELFSVDATTGALSFVREQSVCASPRFARFAGGT